jgi:hypothetical protein
VWASAAFAVWPILRHRLASQPWEWRTRLSIVVSYAIAAFIIYRFCRVESRRLDRSRIAILVILIFVLTCFVNRIHHYFVDEGSLWPSSNLTNLRWQENVQTEVAKLSPGAFPHSYRFLPNGIVFWMQICRINFDTARDIYRLLVGLLLFYAIYRYARLYTDYLGGLLAMLLVAIAYPVGFESYAGQLTDPLSHLSFVLAFIFLETGDFAFLLSTLLIGSLAKENVLALTGFYILFRRSDRRYVPKALALSIASVAIYYGVRFFVLHGPMHYQQVTQDFTLHHISANLAIASWPAIFLIFGGYAAFLVVGWKETPPSLKRLVFYLAPLLIAANLVSGWLRETRNYMPAVFVLSVIAARYISRRCIVANSSIALAQ